MSCNGSTVVLFKDDSRREVFLVFRSDYPIWVTTGGGIESGETPEEAALREAVEETGLEVEICRFVGTYLRKRSKSYLFEGRVLGGSFSPEFPGCKGRWFPVNKLPLRTTNRHREKIQDCLIHKDRPFCKEASAMNVRNNLRLVIRHPRAALNYFRKVG